MTAMMQQDSRVEHGRAFLLWLDILYVYGLARTRDERSVDLAPDVVNSIGVSVEDEALVLDLDAPEWAWVRGATSALRFPRAISLMFDFGQTDAEIEWSIHFPFPLPDSAGLFIMNRGHDRIPIPCLPAACDVPPPGVFLPISC